MQTRRTRPARRGGFTLIEVLLVLAILGVIAAMVVPNLLGSQEKANIGVAKQGIKSIEQAAQLYKIDHNTYPQGGPEVLEQLAQPSTLKGRQIEPYLDGVKADPWGQPFYYQFPSNQGQTKPDVWSGGPDMKNDQGGNDDVANWHTEL